MDKKHIAVVSILTEDRGAHAEQINQILSGHSHLVVARLGVNLEPRCVEKCSGLVTVIAEATLEELRELTEKLDDFPEVTSKTIIMTE